MKVLISAIACDPYLGSENYVGWSAVKALAQEHELWVLTGRRNEANLRRAATEGLVPPNVHFVHAGQCSAWHPNLLRARLQGWKEYLQFSQAIFAEAQRLQASVKFDIVHHVTYATWRVASPLSELGVPFIFGPIGGYEQFPPRLFPILSPTATAFELARMASNFVSRFSPRVRRSLRGAAKVLVANTETERLIMAVRASPADVVRLSPCFFSSAHIHGFQRFAAGKKLDGPLRLFAAGNMEGRKGVALALDALAEARKSGVKFQYRLGAGGPEMPRLRQHAARLGLQSEVLFGEGLRGEDYQRELGETHVFLLPSFRESSGLTMMEAMLAGCVPVVADCGGPGIIVPDRGGYKIPVSNRQQMARQLAQTIIDLDRDRQLIAEKGRLASAHIAAHFSEEHYRNTIRSVYQSVQKS